MASSQQQSNDASDGAQEALRSTDKSTHFAFENKVFKIEQGYFSLTRDTKEPVFHVVLGELRAAGAIPASGAARRAA